MPKVLFIASHRLNRSPSQRYRFEQYFDFLTEFGFQCTLSPIITEKDDKWLYSSGNVLRKALILLKAIIKRRKDLRRINDYDIVFIQREAIMIGSLYFEKKIKKSKAKIVFDFDDSIWLMDTSEGNKRFEWLKNPEKTRENIALADIVFAGNEYLAAYAKKINPDTLVVPTTIDTSFHKPDPELRNKEVITIGWSGSITTIKHFHSSVIVLSKLKEKYGERIHFVVMGDAEYVNENLGIKGIPWSHDTEVAVINSFDIGIMPLPDDEWANGKCGLKGLSYMACGVPTVMSPVGVNTTIIQHGVNGMLAATESEWFEAISELIEQEDLRKKIGENARQTVLDRYSVEANKHLYLESFNKLLNAKKA